MRDLRPELFVEAYRSTKLRPIKGSWMGRGRDTNEACGLSCLAIQERPSARDMIAGLGVMSCAGVVAMVLGMTVSDAKHFAAAWDHSSMECRGCDMCRAAFAARNEVERLIGPVRRSPGE